ncbi:MAG: excinuclease ABC subunit UvrA, partial [Planctomycetota bacterium]|nr:excinuclease ABC subunit UvrA [Planctomycetota bacterium]
MHNLKGVDVDLPKGKLIAITGVSGSGKSSLAYDTLFAEGQRRFLESLSPSARQFLHQLPRPRVERIDGLTPTLAIGQSRMSPNPRATVATVTDLDDYLRLLWSKLGETWCPTCQIPVRRDSPETIADWVMRYPAGTKVLVLATWRKRFSGDMMPVLEELHRQGYARLFEQDRVMSIRELLRDVPKRRKPRDVDVVVDRLVVRADGTPRLGDALETAARLTDGRVKLAVLGSADTWRIKRFTAARVCPQCDHICADPNPKLFSFNSPEGACPTCKGLGYHRDIDPQKLIGDPLCFVTETVPNLANLAAVNGDELRAKVDAWPFDARSTRWNEVPPDRLSELIDGEDGLLAHCRERLAKTRSKAVRDRLESILGDRPCTTCDGGRLNPDAAAVRVAGMTLPGFFALDVATAHDRISGLKLSESDRDLMRDVLGEILARLDVLLRIRLDYLGLNRPAHTLSGGELQRARLATQLGSKLEGVTYILDEPTTGLHQADTERLIALLGELRESGNTVVVVEHDEEVMRAADHLAELGPDAGEGGGQLVWSGPTSELATAKGATAAFLRGDRRVTPWRIRKPTTNFIEVREARLHNLKRVAASFPVGALTVVTGLSGAGKSTLVHDCLFTGIQSYHLRRAVVPGSGAVLGAGLVDRAIAIDSRPLGKGPRSIPVTYIKVMDDIRI